METEMIAALTEESLSRFVKITFVRSSLFPQRAVQSGCVVLVLKFQPAIELQRTGNVGGM